MNTKRLHLLIAAGFLAAHCAGALAQSNALVVSADALVQEGLQTLRKIDEDRAGELWEAASPVMKERHAKAELVGIFQRSRALLGTVSQRSWVSVSRMHYEQANAEQGVPAGHYANVHYRTRLSDGRTAFEQLSFRQEADGNWRLMGYVPRQAP